MAVAEDFLANYRIRPIVNSAALRFNLSQGRIASLCAAGFFTGFIALFI